MTRACAFFVVTLELPSAHNPLRSGILPVWGYTLENSFDTVLAASGARLADARTLRSDRRRISSSSAHRPSSPSTMADPVRDHVHLPRQHIVWIG